MLYSTYTIGGELIHSSKGNDWKDHKYIDKKKTKNGNVRYIYNKEYVEHPNADDDYLNSIQYRKTYDKDGNLVWESTGEKTRKTVNLIDYIIDLLSQERDDVIAKVKEKKKNSAVAKK